MDNSIAKSRNYALDFIKILFTVCVLIWHTRSFVGENTRFQVPYGIGGLAVLSFFVISGALIVQKYMLSKTDLNVSAEEYAFSYILKRYKSILPKTTAALLIYVCGMLCVYIYNSKISEFTYLLPKIFPELFLVHDLNTILFNVPTWYLGSMFLAMIPLVYLLAKNTKFYIYIFSPFAALLIFGYMIASEKKLW